MKKWQCIVCGFVYDEAEGLEEEGIAPGTLWEDVPEDWVCPECGVRASTMRQARRLKWWPCSRCRLRGLR